MADKPILFSAPMVRALLAGTKTQTRRTLKSPYGTLELTSAGWKPVHTKVRVGDRLWVRETWAPLTYLTHNDPGTQAIADGGFYRADEGTVDGEISKWKPSIFMPRHASRLTLTVTDVRVERLQDISEEDAIAEGIASKKICGVGDVWTHYLNPHGPVGWNDPRQSYQSLWESINGPGSWDANPWIVAYTFRTERGNIDQIERAAA
jgi:hypothetical protein